MPYIAFLQNRKSGDKFTITSSQEEATKLAQIASKSVDGVPSISRGKPQNFIKNTIITKYCKTCSNSSIHNAFQICIQNLKRQNGMTTQ